MKCIIIDNEPLAQQILEDYIRHIPFLKLEKKCNSAFEAYEVLQKTTIDLIFLDIHLPNVSGVEFISSLDNRPMFIFTTAYSEYAVEAFDLNAVDYLLKPIAFRRFLKAANKAYQIFSINRKVKREEQIETQESDQDFIMVKSDYKSVKIQLSQILYIEGLKDYVKIYIQNEEKPVITLNSLKKMADSLPNNNFLRVHKSFIINTNKIKSVTKNRIIIHDKWIPIGDNYKNDFQSSVINKFTL
ncbi:MAG: LytR/AlgR family response regulator transcription factor [Mangrovibacterium sp.]